MPINLIFSRIIGIPYLPSVENGRIPRDFLFVQMFLDVQAAAADKFPQDGVLGNVLAADPQKVIQEF